MMVKETALALVGDHNDLPQPEQRCKRSGMGWKCNDNRLPDHAFCQKHYIQRQLQSNKKRRTMTDKKRSTMSSYSAAEEHNRVRNLFAKGQQVEVANNQEGFEDSWYIATVVHPSKGKNNENGYLVEYQTLVAEDGLNPLRECVQVSHLRPLQPNRTSQFFKLDEVVDAFAKDGWWKGVVTEVIGDSRYSVFFRRWNEKREFQHSELRLHMEWIDGKWIFASHTQETGTMVQADVSLPPPNPIESSAHRTAMDTSPTPSGIRSIRYIDGAELTGSREKIIEEAKKFLSFSTTKGKNVMEAEPAEVVLSPTPHFQFQKEQPVLLPTVIKEEALEGVNNQREDGTKNKSSERGSLLFTKSSSMWKDIESNEAFKLIPQNPHFRPLKELQNNEELREATALGKMLTFSMLMEKTCKASIYDPINTFEARLEALIDLEKYGFTVEPLRSRLEQMLKFRVTLNEKENKVAELQRTLDDMKEEMQGISHEFESLAASSW